MKKQIHVRAKGVTSVTFVESDSAVGIEYEIARKADGALACACMAYVFDRHAPKRCKHCDAWQVGNAIARNVTDGVPERVVTQTFAGETFTFRRAIAFDAYLGRKA